MKFSDIREGIEQAGQFLLPPFMNLFILASLTYYIAPYIFTTVFTRVATLNFSFLRDESFQRFVDFYGVSKLAPVFAIIGLVFVLYVVESAVRNLGHILPGYIAHFGESCLMHVLLLVPGKFAELWAKFPQASDASQLISTLRQSLVGLDARLAARIERWEKVLGRYHLLISALKFYLFWCLLLLIALFITKQPLGAALLRVVSISAIIMGIVIVLLIKQIYAIEQIAWAELAAIERVLFEDESLTRYPDKDLINEMLSRVFEFKNTVNKHGRVKWWEFKFFDTYQFKWFYMTFIKRSET
jgi:hypothetical protein